MNWIWKCIFSGCSGRSRRPLTHYKALRNGKIHMMTHHGDRKIIPILIKWGLNEPKN